MAGSRAQINIYVPTICRFPELTVIGGCRDPVQLMLPRLPAVPSEKSAPTALAAVTAASAMEDAVGIEGSGHSLYVIDRQGRVLEHVRYQGTDYRGALRAAINATPTHWKD